MPSCFQSRQSLPSRICRVLVRTALFAALLPGLAGTSWARQAPSDSTLTAALARIEGAPISLERVLELAVARAPSIAEAEASVRAAEAAVRGARGVFDPEIFAGANRAHTEQASASAFSGAQVLTSTDVLGQTGLRTVLPSGTQIEATLNATSLETNSRFTALNPQYNAFGELSVRHPLLAGGGASVRAGARAAESRLDAAQARGTDTYNAVASLAEDLYWSLFAGERDLAVQALVRDNAAAVLEEARLRAQAGLVGPNQVENARVFLAEQELSLLDRQEALDFVSDQLASLIGMAPPGGAPRFKPAHGPESVGDPEPVDTLVARAVRLNPELRAIEFDQSALETQLRAARRDRMPTVDLVAALRSTGLSGTGRTIVFGSDTLLSVEGGTFGESWRQVGGIQYPRWSLGLDVRVPIGGRQRGSEVERLEAEIARAEARREGVIRVLDEQIRFYRRSIDHSMRRLEIAQTGVEASQEQVRLGLIEYRNGQTTAFELVRLSADLAAAERRYSQELVRAARARAELRRLTGERPSVPSHS